MARHKFYYPPIGFHSGGYRPHPYGYDHLEYKRPNSKREYVKLVQFIADHPGLKRKEIIARYYYTKKALETHKDDIARGRWSWVTYNPSRYFAELLWADMIDYDEKTYKYYVTSKGEALLEEAYLADMEALVKSK